MYGGPHSIYGRFARVTQTSSVRVPPTALRTLTVTEIYLVSYGVLARTGDRCMRQITRWVFKDPPVAFIVWIAPCYLRSQRALRACGNGFAVAFSEINNAQSQEVWGRMTHIICYAAEEFPLFNGCVLGCKEYNSNISINGRNIQGVPYHARQRQRSFTIYECSKQTVIQTITTHWDFVANKKISHAIAPLSTNPSCAPKRFRGKNYSHSAAASTETQSKASNPYKKNQIPTRTHKVWS